MDDRKNLSDPETLSAANHKHPSPNLGNLQKRSCFISEINGLKWDDVDLASSHVAVTHVNVRGERKETTKTSQARNLLMNSRALAALKAQKELTWLRGGPVFRHPEEDTPWNDELAFRRSYWTRSLKRLGMRYRRPYQMRHTYACQLLMAGVQVGYCAQTMGHSTETFLRTYTKKINSDRDKAEMARLETAMAADVARKQNQVEAA
ncbi:MAG: tyrosine-type recombinase/integrase [Polaromonas sp.]|nr:tyrosine-type recombinase/integrase [Polaromonas sp.]